MQYNDNSNFIQNRINSYLKFMDDKVRRAMSLGMAKFKGEMIKTQMNGRHGTYFGLNRPTGNLARSWKVRSEGKLEDRIVILASSAKYSRIHQYGGTIDNGWGKGIRIYIPKRLYILENFKTNGRETIMRYLREEFKVA